LARVNPPASEAELEQTNAVRRRFFREQNRNPYMVDIVRAFRLVKGARAYIEVGSRDKGNVAWVASLLDPGATIVDVDLENDTRAEAQVRNELGPDQSYVCVEGNSISDAVIANVARHIPKGDCDVVFLDSNHMYYHFLNKCDLYMDFLRPGGFILAHDVVWEGSAEQKGKAPACELIDRHMPV
jgi:predicted O-methyltransferase YrrM